MSKKIELLIFKPWEIDRAKYPDWKTKSELKKMKLMPHPRAKARALIDRQIGKKDQSYYLYDVKCTVPYKESKREQELRRSRKKRLSCPKCGTYYGKRFEEVFLPDKGFCINCYKQMLREIPEDRIVIYDTETTGLNPSRDEILQFSAIDGSGKVLLNTYIKPEKVSEWTEAERCNGISPAMVADQPHFEHFREEIQKIFNHAKLLIAYNNTFDNRFLKAAGIEYDPKHKKIHYDVMLHFAEIYGEWNYYHRDYKWQTLTTCAAYYGYSFPAHDSLEDVKATLHCFNCMIGKTERK